jgi:O-acetylhomoserine/O-acetylserine sulfhydrylase-like pyridoxal-dependent enzyme
MIDYYFMGSGCYPQPMDAKTKFVTVSSDCTDVSGVCISPYDEGSGYVFADNETYIYKDGLDLVALIIGSGKTNIYGKMSKLIFDYKNILFSKEIIFAARSMGLRAVGIAQSIKPSYKISEGCRPLFVNFAEKMRNIEAIPDNYYETGPTAIIVAKDVQRFLYESKAAYENLVNAGCEV